MKKIISLLIVVALFATAQAKTVWVGTGSGYLNLGNIQTSLSLVPGDIVKIKSGIYDGCFIQNSRFSDSVWVRGGDSGVVFTGTFESQNCKNIVYHNFVIRLNFAGGTRGFVFEANADTCTLRNVKIERCADYGIYLHDGTGYTSTSLDHRFDNISLIDDTIRAIGNANGISTGGAVTKNLVIRRIVMDSTYGATSSGISITDLSFNILVENCKFTHINLNGVSHNAVMYIEASGGHIRGNYCFDRQGNFCRARAYWGDSSASRPKPDTLWVVNNFDDSARKYAFVEIQHRFNSCNCGSAQDTTTNTDLPNIRTGQIVVMNNTVLRGNTSDYFPWVNASGGGSGLVDVYDWIRCPPIIKNNLVARQYMDSIPDPDHINPAFTFNPMFHSGGGSKPSGSPVFGDTSNNIYLHKIVSVGFADSLLGTLTSSSPAKDAGTGAYSYAFNTDISGISRPQGSGWDVGAVEYVSLSNNPPTANAGIDLFIHLPATSITLSGSGTDTDGTIAGYAWVKLSGPSATITSATSATTTVTGLTNGVYVFQLTVTDNSAATGSDTVIVYVSLSQTLIIKIS